MGNKGTSRCGKEARALLIAGKYKGGKVAADVSKRYDIAEVLAVLTRIETLNLNILNNLMH